MTRLHRRSGIAGALAAAARSISPTSGVVHATNGTQRLGELPGGTTSETKGITEDGLVVGSADAVALPQQPVSTFTKTVHGYERISLTESMTITLTDREDG